MSPTKIPQAITVNLKPQDTVVTKGQVRCAKISRGVHHPQIPGFTKINASSTGPKFWKVLSPFKIGPIRIIEPIKPNAYFPDGIHPGFVRSSTLPGKQEAICQIFENYWQGSKIYRHEVDEKGQIKKSFFDRRPKAFVMTKGKRRFFPKRTHGFPISSYYGSIMDYVQSRKLIYCPLYAMLVENTPQIKNLKERLNKGENFLIVGPDGRDIPMTEQSLREAVNDPEHIFGHELVICCLLLGFKVWKDRPVSAK